MKTYISLALSLFFTITLVAQDKTCNCCTEKYSEFDFWLGTWEVTNPNGTRAGVNVIKKVQNNCILQENWISATPGYTGTSNNFYNYKANQWEQIWVDNQGQSLHLKGNKVGNQMILRTEDETNAEGKTFFHRVTWTDNDDGSVRQLWETVTEGKEVAIAFDGLYKRKD
ncbi:hypothetical protein [Winogradskyella sp.]|uniref:hypothetical protein n=1 Tax=Winogradskyella sp. TaxID=1883156 RepID=UPI0026076696|nr:hypothetical protein [Winogradskyella sp.]